MTQQTPLLQRMEEAIAFVRLLQEEQKTGKECQGAPIPATKH